jgi:hypothetical protein
MIRSSKSVSRNPLINVVKPRPRSTPTHLRSARPLCRSPWFAQASTLERTGFEPPIPLLQRALLLAGHPRRRHENRNQLRSGPKTQMATPGALSQPFRSRWDHEFESVFLQQESGAKLTFPQSEHKIARLGTVAAPIHLHELWLFPSRSPQRDHASTSGTRSSNPLCSSGE